MSHFIKKCEFGKSHGTCRCASNDKTVITVPCDRPAQHKPEVKPVPMPNKPWSEIIDDFLTDDEPDIGSVVTPLHDRLQETVDKTFGNMIAPIVKNALITELERDVVAWLTDTAKFALTNIKE